MELGFVFLFGILIGSFMNVVIYRIPNEESIVFPSSKCQSCQTPLKWYHNIPIFSWIALKGKCAFCSSPISKQYPIIEFITGLIFLAVFWKMGITIYAGVIAIVFTLLLALTMIDFKYMAIPDSLNLLALTLAVVQPDFMEAGHNALLAVAGFTLMRFYLSYLLKKEAMGEGDIMIAGTMGAVLGFPLFFFALFLSAILALVPSMMAKDTDHAVPFVPFLALATFIVFLFDNNFMALSSWIMHG
ncbi:Leader peptidase (Prepilin peptidase) / N-methyltransferase [hydrothermal vent metagenome]|uniref:Leader peptidase (Prepilin peptidase) / N-methyltransferase n=1 Tax=hydrothermal vent metagenome TaxID=652676 RepID=A0A1W1EI87_9ZZZZ